MHKQPVAYLRKSHVQNDRHVSWEVQETQVRELAAQRGDLDLLVLSDWSKSGKGSATRLRSDYARLRAMIAAGEVSTLYSYSLSRLARSTRELLDLGEACAAAGVRVRLAKEGDLDFISSHGRLYLTVLAAVATFETEVTGERIADTMVIRRARGDAMGIAPYGSMILANRIVANPDEPLEPLVEAFERAGSCYGAARLLNSQGSRTRRGAMWSSKVLGGVLTRVGVLHHRRPRPGAKANADWITYRLLTCPCGNTMTAMDRRSPRVTCYKARHVPDHPKPFGIAEKKLLPVLMAEASRLRPVSEVESVAQDDLKRGELVARRGRIGENYEDGVIDKAERDRRILRVDEELDQLDDRTRLIEVPLAIDWTWPPAEINKVLRAMWERVELGPDLMPTQFVWKVPDWRSAALT